MRRLLNFNGISFCFFLLIFFLLVLNLVILLSLKEFTFSVTSHTEQNSCCKQKNKEKTFENENDRNVIKDERYKQRNMEYIHEKELKIESPNQPYIMRKLGIDLSKKTEIVFSNKVSYYVKENKVSVDAPKELETSLSNNVTKQIALPTTKMLTTSTINVPDRKIVFGAKNINNLSLINENISDYNQIIKPIYTIDLTQPKTKRTTVTKYDKYTSLATNDNIQEASNQSKKEEIPYRANSPNQHGGNDKLLPGFCVDWFSDVQINKTMYNLKWHPLFPRMPQNSTITTTISEKKYFPDQYAKRIYGYVVVKQTDQYEFQVGSRDGIEMYLLDTGMYLNNSTRMFSVNERKVLLKVNLTFIEMLEQDKKIKSFDVFKKYETVKLEREKIYFVDILQGGTAYGRMNILWRHGNETFHDIDIGNMFHTSRLANEKSTLFHKPKSRINETESEFIRLNFHKTGILRLQEENSSKVISCKPFHRKKIHYDVMGFSTVIIDEWAIYPEEGFGFYHPYNKTNVVLNKTEALDIANQTFTAVNKAYNNTFTYSNIVHVQKNFGNKYKPIPASRQFYFVEFDIISNKDQKLYRVSSYVKKNKDDICFIKELNWDYKTKIYLISPVKNQGHWVKYLIESIENIMIATNESNIELLLIDYNSTDINIEEALKAKRVPYKYTKINAKYFNKVEGINTGLNQTTNNSIAFVLDLHLELPNNIFDRIRKHTTKGYSGYCPTLLKLHKQSHQLYTEQTSIRQQTWMLSGYGMISLYKSDWMAVGGMNAKKFGTAWGGEDWELLDRLYSNGYYVFHTMLPRFYHIHHSNQGIWDGTKL